MAMGAGDIFSPEFKTEPYWWDAAPPEPGDRAPLPERADVAIVGSGYCGLAAALELARAGVQVAVLEAGRLGEGASTRNGGMVGGAIKPDWLGLTQRFGEARAAELRDGARASFELLESLIARERLDADYQRTGRFLAACNPHQFKVLVAQARVLAAEPSKVRLVPHERQHEEIGTDLYHGGLVIEEAGGVDAAKLHRGLRQAAEAAGAGLHGRAAVEHLEREAGGFRLETARGTLRAERVFVATNGYTGALTPALRRRVVPVASYIIATELLPEELARRLSPRGRMFVDGNRLLAYFRLSPDGRRVLFGGRVAYRDLDERAAAQALHRKMCQVWPELRGCRVTHSWRGNVAFTFDRLPHMGVQSGGEQDGVHFAMGCNGSGVAMATYLGHQTALKLLGRQNRPCPFDGLPFPTRALYDGRPWFLPAAGAWFRLQDVLDSWRR
jgi:glycine/D-amino acid oxidase-like deaminating enzyme